jgi:predicted RNA-binding protein YlxR (DUF448 family)
VAPKPTLLRLVLSTPPSGEPQRPTAVLDRRQRLPGRGAYLCRDGATGGPVAACLQRAERRGGLTRAFRAGVSIDGDFVESSP